jgi:Micrococcal nuclease (thermonuclease) homologs
MSHNQVEDMRLIIIVAVMLGVPTSVSAWPASIVKVIDGDSLIAEPISGGGQVKVRLYGVDAPEMKQPGGQSASEFVRGATLYKVVEIRPAAQGHDRYGRTVAVVILPSGDSLQALLIHEGLAWVYPRYCRDCTEWTALQEEARRLNRGLWAAPYPVPPWEWRRR